MGNYSSILNNDTQKISTTISQISSANCLNTCLESNNTLAIKIDNTTINGDINFTQSCFITGASCILKSSLDNTLINNQTNKQKGSIKDEEDPLNFMADLIPSTDNINQSNYQSIADNITQMISSSCQNSANVSNNSSF